MNRFKIIVFTHKDLDGISCPILLRLCYDDVDAEYCGYEDINQKIMKFINSDQYKDYDKIFITDISVSEETAKVIDAIPELANKIVLLDHHDTAKFLNKYTWAMVKERMNAVNKTCGTQMLWDWLYNEGKIASNYAKEYVENVRQYDTWEWADLYNSELPKRINILFGLYKSKKFSSIVEERISTTCDFSLSNEDNTAINKELERIDYEVKKHMKNLYDITISGHTAKVSFADGEIGDIAHAICKEYPDVDIAVVVNMSNGLVSYRTEKDNINLGLIAKEFGGGGHPKAAGSQIDKLEIEKFVHKIFPINRLIIKEC